ncbi:hypothetical protein [Thalassobaculum sp.]|uniref:hypothetical protein n=1 Tax=Thalassobaculum sp. TaxID=2022740 RepID=UPI0032EEB3C4
MAHRVDVSASAAVREREAAGAMNDASDVVVSVLLSFRAFVVGSFLLNCLLLLVLFLIMTAQNSMEGRDPKLRVYKDFVDRNKVPGWFRVYYLIFSKHGLLAVIVVLVSIIVDLVVRNYDDSALN